MKHLNAKPSEISNIGADIMGAQRHNFDTYDNDEKRKQKEKRASDKTLKNKIESLKVEMLSKLDSNNFLDLSNNFEIAKCVLTHFPELQYNNCIPYSDTLKSLRANILVADKSYTNEQARAFNKIGKLVLKNHWNIRSLQDAREHYASKKKRGSFTEMNGRKSLWRDSSEINAESIQYLADTTLGVQFGNSVPDTERTYCINNLAKSLKQLQNVFSFNFKPVAFSFGARGKAGSVAHYEDNKKVIAMNRHIDGALAHELGHAIDYALGMASDNITYSMRTKYKAKLKLNPANVGSNLKYYMGNKEIFARLFEQYLLTLIPNCDSFLQFTFDSEVMPDLDEENLAFIKNALKEIIK